MFIYTSVCVHDGRHDTIMDVRQFLSEVQTLPEYSRTIQDVSAPLARVDWQTIRKSLPP